MFILAFRSSAVSSIRALPSSDPLRSGFVEHSEPLRSGLAWGSVLWGSALIGVLRDFPCGVGILDVLEMLEALDEVEVCFFMAGAGCDGGLGGAFFCLLLAATEVRI
jgi:hypothetical protein